MEGVIDVLFEARALVLRDLTACDLATAAVVDIVEDIITERRWWVDEWPEGEAFALGQIAQDVQDRLLDEGVNWPVCPRHGLSSHSHDLHVEPDMGPHAVWTCALDAMRLAPVGQLHIALATIGRIS